MMFCYMCNRVAKFVVKRDKHRKFKFAYLQSESGKALLNKFDLPTTNLNTFVYIVKDKYYIKSSAALHVLKDLGGIWKLTYVFIVFPRPFRDLFYNIITKTWYKIFGRSESCLIPTPDIKSRFIL